MKHLISLINKFLDNTISNEEIAELEALLQDPKNKMYFKSCVEEDYLLKTSGLQLHGHKTILDPKPFPKSRLTVTFRNVIRYAAAILLLGGLGWALTTLVKRPEGPIVVEKYIKLKLGDGTERFIANEQRDTITGKNNSVIGYINAGQLSYSDTGISELVYNTIQIPFGKQFEVKLSDGTVVYLNAGSSLRYPVSFLPENRREVYMTGEAFFDVSKDRSRPFIVYSDQANVKVLGTRFNISDYSDDTEVKVTLEEGSIEVGYNDVKKRVVLSPNQQAVFNRFRNQMDLHEIDASIHASWVDGNIIFRETPFAEIIKVLSRRFGVEIINKNDGLDDMKFTGHFKEETINEILSYLGESSNFDFKFDGNMAIIE